MTDPRDRLPSWVRLDAAWWFVNGVLAAALLAFAFR